MISAKYFDGVRFVDSKSVSSAVATEVEESNRRWAKRAAEQQARENEWKTNEEARNFWGGLTPVQKREYRELNSDSDRTRWMQQNGGTDLLSLNSVVAIAVLMSIAQNGYSSVDSSSSASGFYSEGSRSASTDYSSSSSTDYGSSSSFGGGSFDSGGGAGGSW